MKKIIFMLFACQMLAGLVACNDEWKEELYTKLVSLKAPLNNEGVSPIYLRYQIDGVVNYNLPVILSGSQTSGTDIDVKLTVDNDTVGIMNQEKFQYRSDLYYKQLPEQFYEFASSTCRIPAGSATANFPITFKFSNLDLVEKWVLPLMIKEDPAYQTNKRKGWRKALLYILPFNDYSGNYSSTSMNVYFRQETDKPMVMSNRTTWVVDEKSVFFYAGMIDERDINRSKYKVILNFGESTVGTNGNKTGPLTVTAPDQSIGFTLLNSPTYEIREVPDATLPYLIHRYYTVNLEYRYDDITTLPGTPLTYRAKGSMTMERKLNTLMPDEDQAIQW